MFFVTIKNDQRGRRRDRPMLRYACCSRSGDADILLASGGVEMTQAYFTNLENILREHLCETRHSLKAAVAWINFQDYSSILEQLLQKGVKVRILVNDDAINRKYQATIDHLVNMGAKIRFARSGGIFHHKFCVIDKKICLFGSFNWTTSASMRNIEDLNVSDETNLVLSYLTEFKALWELTKEDLKLLRSPEICEFCGYPKFNIMLMEQDGDNSTKADVIQQCSCGQKTIATDYFDISVYNNYCCLLDDYHDMIMEAEQEGDQVRAYRLKIELDYKVYNYLSGVRQNRMGVSIIHAVGIQTVEWINKHEDCPIYRIVWKERGTEDYIEDQYDVE